MDIFIHQLTSTITDAGTRHRWRCTAWCAAPRVPSDIYYHVPSDIDYTN